MIQLRITPFLIRSKKSPAGSLGRIRDAAARFVSKNERNPLLAGQVGLLCDGIGFSYFLFERDPDKALTFLSMATELLARREKSLMNLDSSETGELGKTAAAFFRALLATSHWDTGICCEIKSENNEGDQKGEFIRETRLHYQRAYDYAKHTPWHIYKALSAHNLAGAYWKEAGVELERTAMIDCLTKAVELGEEALRWFGLWSTLEADFLGGSWIATYYQQLAKYSDPKKRRKLMFRSLDLARRAEQLVKNPRVGLARYKLVNLGDIFFHNSEYYRQLAIQAKNESSPRTSEIGKTLNRSLENCLKSREYYRDGAYRNRLLDSSLLAGDTCYELMCLYGSHPDKAQYAKLSKRYLSQAIRISRNTESNEKLAESYWRMAQVFDKEGDFGQSALYYGKAHEAYKSVRVARAGSVFKAPSDYMLAWTKIELAKLAHRMADFKKASELYAEAATLIASTRRWQSRSHLYVATSLIEKSEEESLRENPQNAIRYFMDAIRALTRLQTEILGDESEDAKSFIQHAGRITSFCNARIILERAKESYRVGNVGQSIDELSLAEDMFAQLAGNSEASDSLGSNELSSLAALCKALRSFQAAQVTGNFNLYLDAREIFGRASEQSKSKILKPLLSGLANFAAFLYHSSQIEESLDKHLDVEKLLECNKALTAAEVVFRRLGNRSFLNMLKASQYILDATMKMNAAEREMESAELKARLYNRAQLSLSRASKHYELLGSSIRVKESLRMISAVRNHQKLLPLAHDIIAEIASNQIIYAAISSATLFDKSPENSARDLDTAYVVLDLNVQKQDITLNQEATIEVQMSNIGKEDAITVRIDEIVPEDFEILDDDYPHSNLPSFDYAKKIGAGLSETICLRIKPKTTGEFIWHPALVYLDNNGNYRISRCEPVRVAVESDKYSDITMVLSEKARLERELGHAESMLEGNDDVGQRERVYEIRENISRIEESLYRLRNEYDKMRFQLEQIRTDIRMLRSSEDNRIDTGEIKGLEGEERLLCERIERRRLLLEQAHLL
jgi:hypothetical protein